MAMCSSPVFSFLAARGDHVILDQCDGFFLMFSGPPLVFSAVDAIAMPDFVAECLRMALLAVLTTSNL